MLHSENSGFSTCGSHRENFLNFDFDGFHLHFFKVPLMFPFHINVRCLVWHPGCEIWLCQEMGKSMVFQFGT